MDFKSLHLIEPLLKALHEEGYRTPTPIQSQAIPLVLQGRDLLGVAQTGTGKTAAFSLPILQLLGDREMDRSQKKYAPKRRGIRSLILTPTRELAVQIDDSLKAYGRHLKLRTAVIFGGVSQGSQTNALRKGVDIVVATPGRLLDLMDQGHIHLDDIEIFVLDEADRMLDMGFVRDVQKIIAELPNDRQSLFFSATMPPAIVRLADDILYKPERIEVTPVSSTVDLIEQSLYYVEKRQKLPLLIHILQDEDIKSALVFTRTKYGADGVARTLSRNHIKAEAIHGNKAQNARQRALNSFKEGKIRVLVATDIAARGIDVDDLEYVIQYEIPNVPETYVHRIGRTGRAGAAGSAMAFCASDEKPYIRDIEKLIGKRIPVVFDHPFTKPDNLDEVREARGKGENRKRTYEEERARVAQRDRILGRNKQHPAPHPKRDEGDREPRERTPREREPREREPRERQGEHRERPKQNSSRPHGQAGSHKPAGQKSGERASAPKPPREPRPAGSGEGKKSPRNRRRARR